MHRLPIFLLFSWVPLLWSGLAGAQDNAVVHDIEDYVAFGVIDPGVAFTWEAQVQFDDLTEALPRGYTTLLEIVEADGLNRLYFGIVNGNWQIESNDNNSTEGDSCADGVALCTPTTLVEDVPYHLALTLDGAAFVLYVDGVSVFSGTLPSVPVFGSAQWVTGADTDDGITFGSDSLAAKMDDVRLWAGVIPTSQLTCLADYALTGTEGGLISYWPMDEVPGTATAPDGVAGVNPGSLLGGADFVPSPFGLIASAGGDIPCYDFDGDGYSPSAGDCDDADASLNPGIVEVCDGIDNDCDLATDEDFDADADGVTTCGADGVPGTADDDCDDAAPTTYPSAPEICDGFDNDCDGSIPAVEDDADVDTWMVCESDCDDMDAAVYPGAIELCDAIDSDCDGDLLDEFGDFDGDGIADCVDADDDNDGDPDVSDCNDADAAIYNGAAEACDTIDSDCDGDFVDGFPDLDGDGIPDCTDDDVDGDGDPAATDCDDMDPGLYTGAPELCDGLDNDCDPSTWADANGEIDFDQDGALSCLDCDDNDGANFNGNVEVCDGYDNDCNGLADFVSGPGGDDDDSSGDDDDSAAPPPVGLDELDVDGDGELACADDCDDTNPEVNTGTVESSLAACSDGLDNDCDGDIDTDDSDCEDFVGDDDDSAGDDDDSAGDDDDSTGDDDDSAGDDDDSAGDDDDDDTGGDDDDSFGPLPDLAPECSCAAGGGAASSAAGLMLLFLCGLGWIRRHSFSAGN